MAIENEDLYKALLDNTKAIGDLSHRIDTYHGDFRFFQGTTEQRVTSLEKGVASAKMWENIKMICVLPVVAALHYLAQRLGGKG